MIATLLLAVISLLDFHDNGQHLSITASDNDLRLNEPLKLEVRSQPALNQEVLKQIERVLATQKNEGLLLLFLSSIDSSPDGTTFTLLPQFAGHFTLNLSSIKFGDSSHEVLPFPFSVEAFPTYDELLLPAPKIPLEPNDPLELDESNKRKLAFINSSDDASSLLAERSIPFSKWIAFAIAAGLASVFYVILNRPQEEPKPRKISRKEALELFGLAKTLPKKQGTEAIHNLLLQYMKEGSTPPFMEQLNHLRFQQDVPSDEEWKVLIVNVSNYLAPR